MESDFSNPVDNKTIELTQKHMTFIENQNNCALCGSQLSISVESYLEDFTLKEEAYCPHCQIKTRIKDHKMQ